MNLKLIPNITLAAILVLLPLTSESSGQTAGAGAKGGKGNSPAGKSNAPSALESFARRFGFGSADDVAIAPVMTVEEIVLMISPFRGAIIDTIITTGNNHTNRKTIVREMASQQGARLSGERVARDESYLRGLGYFSSVTVRAEETAEGRCRIRVVVDERPGLFMKYPFPVLDYSICLMKMPAGALVFPGSESRDTLSSMEKDGVTHSCLILLSVRGRPIDTLAPFCSLRKSSNSGFSSLKYEKRPIIILILKPPTQGANHVAPPPRSFSDLSL